MGSDRHKQWLKKREASEAKMLAKREARAAARQIEPLTPMSDSPSDDESTSTTANTVTSKVEELIQTYRHSWTAEKRNESLADILYAAGSEMYTYSSTTDWRLRRVIQAVIDAIQDVNTSTSTKDNASHHLKRRFQSRSEGSALPPYAHIHAKVVEGDFKAVEGDSDPPVLRRLNQYEKWAGTSCSWQAWYQGLYRAYHEDCSAGLDPTKDVHALGAWNAILNKLPQQVLVTLLSEGALSPERPDPSVLLTALDESFGLGM